MVINYLFHYYGKRFLQFDFKVSARFAGKSVNDEDYLTVDQIDLVPTTSLLLGVPIPFSNLGSVIESLFDADIVGEALRLNAVQVLRYAQDYVRFFDASLHATLSPILSSGAGNEVGFVSVFELHIFAKVGSRVVWGE